MVGPCVPREIKGTRPWSGRPNLFRQSEMALLFAPPEKCCQNCLTRTGVVRDRMTGLLGRGCRLRSEAFSESRELMPPIVPPVSRDLSFALDRLACKGHLRSPFLGKIFPAWILRLN